MKNFIEVFSAPFYLRTLVEADVEEVHLIWTDAHVRRYLFDDVIIPVKTTLEEIRTSLSTFAKNGYGLWAVFFKADHKMIGFTGYRNFHEPPELQLLYGLLSQFCGKGYATRLAQIMLKYGFEELGLEEIIASADAPNLASIRVMEKAGMRFDKRVDIDGLDTVYYKMRKEDFEAGAVAYKLNATRQTEAK